MRGRKMMQHKEPGKNYNIKNEKEKKNEEHDYF